MRVKINSYMRMQADPRESKDIKWKLEEFEGKEANLRELKRFQ